MKHVQPSAVHGYFNLMCVMFLSKQAIKMNENVFFYSIPLPSVSDGSFPFSLSVEPGFVPNPFPVPMVISVPFRCLSHAITEEGTVVSEMLRVIHLC